MGTGESGEGPLRLGRQEHIHRLWGKELIQQKRKPQERVGHDGMKFCRKKLGEERAQAEESSVTRRNYLLPEKRNIEGTEQS